jgi:hypothetical protein
MANAVMDSLFGTRYHTEGATIQRPRKVPMRVEPKSYFGAFLFCFFFVSSFAPLERFFLSLSLSTHTKKTPLTPPPKTPF